MNSIQMKIANFKQQISVIEQEISRLQVQDNQNRFQELKEFLKDFTPFKILSAVLFNGLDASIFFPGLDEIEHLLPVISGNLRIEKNDDPNQSEPSIQFNNLIECAKALNIQIDWNSGIELFENKITSLTEMDVLELSECWITSEDAENLKSDYRKIADLLKIENNKQIMSDWAKRQIERDK